MKEILKDLFERLTSRTFVVLVVTIYLLVNKLINSNDFILINATAFGGTSFKDIVSMFVTKQTAALSDSVKEIDKAVK